MRLKFEKVRYKNFMASGKNWIEIELDKYQKNLMIGHNGAGKTQLIVALAYSLFKETYRDIKLGQLINSINKKDSVVEVEFSTPQHHYKVVRGQKPSIFEIWIDGNLHDPTADPKTNQMFLESDILKMNYKTFTQLVVVGAGNYIPFMQLTPADRRTVIEDLLDIKIFSIMNSFLKDDKKDTKSQYETISIDLNNAKSKCSLAQSYINDVQKDVKTDIEKHENNKKDIQNNLELQISELEKVQKGLDDIKIKISKFNKSELEASKNKGLQFISSKQGEKNLLEKDIKFFEKNSVCPSCRQKIDETFKSEHLKSHYDEVQKINDLSVKAEKRFKTIQNELAQVLNLENEENKLDRSKSQIEYQISKLKSDIQNIDKWISDLKNKKPEEKMENDLKKFQADVEKIETEFEMVKERLEIIKLCSSLLDDTGIKARIIKQYIPIINKTINHYLEKMGLFCLFTLDENFKEHIMARYRDEYSYGSFSEGEKFRINLAIMLTWRELSRIRANEDTNLLILDEVADGSGDHECIESFIKILNSMTNSNIFVISHNSAVVELLQDAKIMKFQKVKDFTTMEII